MTTLCDITNRREGYNSVCFRDSICAHGPPGFDNYHPFFKQPSTRKRKATVPPSVLHDWIIGDKACPFYVPSDVIPQLPAIVPLIHTRYKQLQMLGIGMSSESIQPEKTDIDKRSHSTVVHWSISTASLPVIQRVDGSLGASELIADRFIKRTECLGRGGFGAVYLGHDKHTDQSLAIKMERIDNPHGRLNAEMSVYEYIWAMFPETVGYPEVHWFGLHKGDYVLIMDRLGKSLLQHQVECGGRFSIKTVLMIGIQALRRLETLHNADYVHRDVKPENMTTGMDDEGTIYFLDLGLARMYRNPLTKIHGHFKKERGAGSVPFLPTNVHEGIAATRRDDLESLGFSLLYMYNGSLPWFGEFVGGNKVNTHFKNLREELHDFKVGQMKQVITEKELCKGMPRQMEEYFTRVRNIVFDERPEYGRLGKLFEEALEDAGYTNDRKFDWQS